MSIKSVAENRPYPVGSTLNHAKFGSGVVLQYEGSGQDARIQINFRDAGTKWLALAIARFS
jgi:DNA helicase-2/ATP-dependent DNA helicase PcrA